MKRKLLFILGIVLLVVGIGVFLFPIVSQARNAHKQRVMMDEVKQQIINSMFAADTDEKADTQKTDPGTENSPANGEASTEGNETTDSSEEVGEETGTDTANTADNTPDTDSESEPATLAGDLVEEETVEEATYTRSRLSGQKCIGIITIETINLIYPVVEGVETDNIGVAIGHFPDSAAIGAEGNCAMAGHNGGTYGRYFGDIKNLKVGDEVILTNTKGEEYKYYVTESFVVEPTDVYVVGDLGVEGKYLTMVTCTQHGSKRLIVRAQCTEEASKMRGLK